MFPTIHGPGSRASAIGMLVGGLLLCQSAGAVLTHGAQTVVSTADCPSFCTNFIFGDTDGGENSTSAASDVNTDQGNAQAFVQLESGPGLNTPTVQGESFSEGGVLGLGSAFSTAVAVDGYTNTGPGRLLSLDVDLDAIVSAPVGSEASVRAQVYVFEADNFFFTRSLGTLLFEANAVVLDFADLSLTATGTMSATLDFFVDTSEQVVLWARLDTEARRTDAVADAFSTLTTSFSSTTDLIGLVAASNPDEIIDISVPEPGTLGLLGAGVLGLVFRRKKAA